ncbi:diphosphomevalonate decarboxylase [Candidatus Woesearchaeota archaeon]|nr:diphosphomevalonate decarboxylase [Candidatus Woesearchaeota archaeon]
MNPTMMKATSRAHPNIALIKYWGKRNNELILPFTNSLSVTLDNLETVTTVDFSSIYREDLVILNEVELLSNSTSFKIIHHIDLIWDFLMNRPRDIFVKVVSKNNFPTAAGFASSSSGIAALTYATILALHGELSWSQISLLARRGSGSACRSVYGGFVEWHAGKEHDGRDSYATKVHSEYYWPDFRMLVIVLSSQPKYISSREAMAVSVKTSPLFPSWIIRCERDIIDLKKALDLKAFSMLGKIAEENSLAMHAVMEASQPSIIYHTSETQIIISAIQSLRRTGLNCYLTSDAGSNIQIIALHKDISSILESLKQYPFIQKIITCGVGKGVEQIKEDLF